MHPLKKYLKEKRMTQTEFASKIGVSITTIHYIINHTIIPKPETAKKIANITGIPILELLYPKEKS
ncbi:MAG: helix-turn-helix transcriptional regulator [bacterium]|jgi:transcriptional regulator with XRE-family HTH domain